MVYYLTTLKDIIGNNYIGIKLSNTIVEPYLMELKEIIGEDDYLKFTKLQKDRDRGSYHITVINVMDYNRLSKEMGIDKFVNSLDLILKYPIDDLKMMGIGTAERNNNRAYFIVCESDKLDAVRKRFQLRDHDFHTTLGFFSKDVFGVPKNEVIKKKGKFLKLLSIEYYKNENWNFVRKIGNFDLDPKTELIPISITENNLKLKSDNYYIHISYLEDGEKFWIMSKYTVEEELPRLSKNEITKIFNKD